MHYILADIGGEFVNGFKIPDQVYILPSDLIYFFVSKEMKFPGVSQSTPKLYKLDEKKQLVISVNRGGQAFVSMSDSNSRNAVKHEYNYTCVTEGGDCGTRVYAVNDWVGVHSRRQSEGDPNVFVGFDEEFLSYMNNFKLHQLVNRAGFHL